jgi:hypothetical protein
LNKKVISFDAVEIELRSVAGLWKRKHDHGKITDNEFDAINYKNKKLDLAKIQGQINSQSHPRYIDKNRLNILELTQEYNYLMANNFNMIKYTAPV